MITLGTSEVRLFQTDGRFTETFSVTTRIKNAE